MARINIEDEFWIEVIGLVAKLGDQDRAVGQALRFFRVAQEHHKRGKLISEAEFVRGGFDEALIGIFAERTETGIRAVGAEKHFGWLAERVKAGKTGGRSKTEAKTKSLKQNRSKTEANRSKTEASPSPSPSFSNSPSCKNTVSSKQTKAGAFVVGYKSRFLSRWGVRANVEGKDAGIAKRIAERLSHDEIENLLDAFFEMPDSELVKKKHPVFLFEAKFNEITVYAQSGQFTTMTEAREADKNLRGIQDQSKIFSDPEFVRGFDGPQKKIVGGYG